MSHQNFYIIKKVISKKLAVLLLLAITGVASFASLGEGNKRIDGSKKNLLSGKTITKQNSFSLRSGYTYRGSQVLNTQPEKRYIRINTVVNMQKGNTTYVVPLKKKVGVGNIKIDISNRQFQRN